MDGAKRDQTLAQIRAVLDLINESYGAFDVEAPMVLLKRLLKTVPDEVLADLFATA